MQLTPPEAADYCRGVLFGNNTTYTALSKKYFDSKFGLVV